jgi:5'-3' exonuclease
MKSLMGDVSDNIPGVKGFGQKTISKYLKSLLF